MHHNSCIRHVTFLSYVCEDMNIDADLTNPIYETKNNICLSCWVTTRYEATFNRD